MADLSHGIAPIARLMTPEGLREGDVADSESHELLANLPRRVVGRHDLRETLRNDVNLAHPSASPVGKLSYCGEIFSPQLFPLGFLLAKLLRGFLPRALLRHDPIDTRLEVLLVLSARLSDRIRAEGTTRTRRHSFYPFPI